jgi:NADPH:quinone reductase-like Zn-dependent oxidoreductase
MDGFILWNMMPGTPTSPTSVAEWDAMMDFLFEAAKDGKIPISKTYPLPEVKEAVKHAFSGSREGKVMLKCNDDLP